MSVDLIKEFINILIEAFHDLLTDEHLPLSSEYFVLMMEDLVNE